MSSNVEYPDLRVGFIGAGNMATAMAKGFLGARLITAENVIASARTETTLKEFRRRVDEKVVVTTNNAQVAKRAGEIFLFF